MSHKASGISDKALGLIDDASIIPEFDLRSYFSAGFFMPDDDGSEGEEGEGESEGDEGEGGGATDTNDIKDPEKKRLSDEAAMRRTQLRAAEAELAELRKFKEEQENANKTEVEREKSRADKAEEAVTTLSTLVTTQAQELAFFKSGAAALFRDPPVAMTLLGKNLSALEVVDGEVDDKAVKEAAEALLKEKPYLGADKADDSGQDDDKQQASGRPANGPKDKNKGLDMTALQQKFPALRR